MTSSRFGIACAVAALLLSAACTDTESATNLQPDGPPMIEQVVMYEATVDMAGNEMDKRVFGFGTLPGADASIEHSVSSAAVAGQNLRIVMDELLRGNRLEEIACRANVGPDGMYSTVPDGATPDDIAKCAVAQDVLKASCVGDHAVCICQLDAGCLVGTDMVAKGAPVGVQDLNQDGAADSHRFIPTSVTLQCGTNNVTADPAASYWYPSGDQEIPATGGIEAIGPAIVWWPSGPIPTNTTCNLKFADNVVDKTDIQVCAPVGGRTTDCAGNLDQCKQTCTPGDVSAFSFKTLPLLLTNQTFANNDMGVDKNVTILLGADTVLDMATITPSLSITKGGTAVTGYTITSMDQSGKTQILIAPPTGGYAPNTTYVLTAAVTLKDTFGQPLPMPMSWTFTTGA